jgi:hypothetical protein
LNGSLAACNRNDFDCFCSANVLELCVFDFASRKKLPLPTVFEKILEENRRKLPVLAAGAKILE